MAKELPEIRIIEHYCEIPDVFQSSDTDAPFSNCTICNAELIESDSMYIIEKAIKNYKETQVKDVIFEYALCLNCLDEMRHSLSNESKEKIDQYLLDKSDLAERRETLINDNRLDVNEWISNCFVNDEKAEELPEYQIMCQCQGKHMLFTYMPFMLSCNAAEEIQQLLSKQTKEELDRFYNENLNIPPELEEFFKTKTLIF